MEVASKGQLRMSFLRIALVTVPAVVLLGTLSGVLSNSGYENGWFRSLDLPGFMPPSWAFPVAWTILYILLGLVLAMIVHARGAAGRGLLISLFILQLLVNYSWSPLFFGLHQVEVALGAIVTMIVLTLVLIVLVRRIRPVAALLLLPYLAWICFATALNYRIMVDNPGASRLAPVGASTDIPID
jgi:benzodiazapine receptor